MKASAGTTNDSSPEEFEKDLLRRFAHLSIDDDIRKIGENVRQQAILEIQNTDIDEDQKRKIIRSISLVAGAREGEYLVVAKGDCGRNVEFGTVKSFESPWFNPAFVTVAGSIHKCLHGALSRALVKARRFPAGR